MRLIFTSLRVFLKVFYLSFFNFLKVFSKRRKKFEVFLKNFQGKKNEIFLFQNKKQEISPKISPPAEKEQKTRKKERMTCFGFCHFY